MDHPERWIEARALGFPKSSRRFLLWGSLPAPPRLAVVGSRAAFLADRPAVDQLVGVAREEGWTLISGGALGVDGWMHRAGLAQGVDQLAVLPCGPEELYPPRHRALFHEIARRPGSGVLFGLGEGRSVERHVFVARNEIVVRACSALMVVQSRRRSGSVWTGKRSLALARKTAVLDGSPGSDLLVGKGACSLGKARDPQLASRMRAWLGDRALPECELAWPERFSGLAEGFERRPGESIGVDDFPEPLLAAAQLGEALALGLIRETQPGRFLPV